MTSQPHDPRWQRPEDSGAPTSLRPGTAGLVDPEDDLPTSTYSGDYETTAIPRYDSGSPTTTGLGLMNDPEPLPYVQPGASGRHAAITPKEIAADGDIDDRVRAAGRRGTQDLGLLVLRAGLGALLVAHGLQKVFGWWGGAGLNGFQSTLSGLGFEHASILTYLAAGTEIAAGVLLVLGLFTPLAAAAALAYLINVLLAAVASQPDNGYVPFFLPDGHEFEITLIVVAVAVILTGPGRYGFDAGRGWARRPFIGSIAALLLGVGGGIAIWMLLNGANPLA